ncbi:MAG: 50S ribosomal protein L9 [Rickettsiales bacterium]|nr:50S ribosomal protein L9 [Rickettsiales bacterium]OUT46925.1 MAG: 50S ribosomal protein L9 [Pelagibacteraceae bacterium TMED13]|tara:strand:- start:247 stop:891 length:645 start_codon:yes stop_codon:yes gene_type:complete
MEVILLETFDRLGKIGDVVKVKDGFARNFLIPQKKALRANDTNKDYFAKIKTDLLEKSKKAVDEASLILKKIENKDIIFIRNASDNGQLYGSVSPKDISNYFAEQKVDIKPSSINLYTSIKKIGIYDINVKLHAEVTCTLKINVATSEENAIKQKNELNKPKELKKNEEKDVDLKATKSEPKDTKNVKESQKKSPEDSNEIDSSAQSEEINDDV